MKKTIYSSLALGAVLTLASCASDEPLGNNQNDGSLSFTVTLPGQNTRFAEGTTVDRLYYSVFDTEGHLVLQNNEDWPAGSLTTTVTLQLVANQSYDIVFFADNKEAEGKGYTYNAETAQFSVTYGQDVLSGINFRTGNTTAQAADLSFGIADFSQLPADEFPVPGYSYIEMNYLLVAPTEGETANLINATYTINGKAGASTVNTLNLASTPVRQNYRTNIYGSLLTTQNAFNVEINPAFEGTLVQAIEPEVNEAGNYELASPNNLQWLYTQVNNGDDFSGKTLELSSDIDMTGIAWTSLGTANKPFSGSINGNGHTISGLSDPLIYQYKVSDSENSTKIENLKIVSDNARGAALIAVISTGAGKEMIIDNVEISGTVNGIYGGNAHYYMGGIVATLSLGNMPLTISNCKNHAMISSDNSNSQVGGLIGHISSNVTLEKCMNDGELRGATVGGIVAEISSTGLIHTINNCSNSGNIYGNSRVGGIVANINGTIDIDGCSNSGTLTATPAGQYPSIEIGGIIADWWQSTTGYNTEKFNFSNLTNTGKIIVNDPENKCGSIYVGGIAGNFSTMRKSNMNIILSRFTDNGPITINRSKTSDYIRIGCLVGNLSITNSYNLALNFNDCTVGTDSQVTFSNDINITRYAVYGNKLVGQYASMVKINNLTNSTSYSPHYTE